ncbi:hypothetical protein ACFCYX_16915 [Streptomyces populi]
MAGHRGRPHPLKPDPSVDSFNESAGKGYGYGYGYGQAFHQVLQLP